MLCLFVFVCLFVLRKLTYIYIHNPHLHFSWNQLRKIENSGASCPAPLENDNYISLYPPNYSHRRDWCLLNNNHISMPMICDANVPSDTHVNSLSVCSYTNSRRKWLPGGQTLSLEVFSNYPLTTKHLFSSLSRYYVTSMNSVPFFPHKIPSCKPNPWVIICCGCRDAGSQPAHQHSSLHQRINLLPEVDFLSLGYCVYSNSQNYKCHYFISIPLYLICQLSFLYSSSY